MLKYNDLAPFHRPRGPLNAGPTNADREQMARDPAYGPDYEVLHGQGRADLCAIAVAGPPVRFNALAAANPQNPYTIISSIQIPKSYIADHVTVSTWINEPQIGDAVQFSIFLGNGRTGQIWLGPTDEYQYPLRKRSYPDMIVSIRATILPAFWATGATPIRSQIKAYAAMELHIVSDLRDPRKEFNNTEPMYGA